MASTYLEQFKTSGDKKMIPEIEKTFDHMIWNINWLNHDDVFESQSNIEKLRELFDYAKKYELMHKIDFLRLNVNDFRALNKEYPDVLKNALLTLFMTNIKEISLEELKDLIANYNIQYLKIASLHKFEQESRMSIDLVYRYKKAIMKMIKDVNTNLYLDNPDREKYIFGQVVEKIFESTKIDENIQKETIEKHDRKMANYDFNNVVYSFTSRKPDQRRYKLLFDNPSNEMLGLLKGKCVCRGMAGIVRDVLNELDIDVNVVVGLNRDGSGNGHAWNQIKLDGVWYNADVTWDIKYILGRGMSCWLLRDDNSFEKGISIVNEGRVVFEEDHETYSQRLTTSVPCNESIPREEIGKYVDLERIRKKLWLRDFVEEVKEIKPLKQVGVK